MAELPSIPLTPTLPAAPQVKAPRLPVKVTKINVETGVGAPGGFSGASNKIPSVEAAKYQAAQGKLAAQLAQANSLQGKVTGAQAAQLADAKKKLSNAQSAAAKKAANIKKSAPDFTNPVSVPKIPEKPEIDLPQVDLPQAPNVPEAPTIPSVSVPKIGP